MQDNTKKEIIDLVKGLEDSDSYSVKKVSDPVLDIQMEAFDFVKDRIKNIKEREILNKEVERALLEKIGNDELKPAQLIKLYQMSFKEITSATDVLFNLFRPNPNSSDSLWNNPNNNTPPGSKEMDEAFHGMSDENIKTLDKFFRWLQSKKEKFQDE